MSKYKQAPVYIGDVGEIVLKPSLNPEPAQGIDLSTLTFRQLCNLAVECGFDIRILIGVDSCDKHDGMIFLGDKEMPEGYNLFDHCTYCKHCWHLFRLRSI